MKSERIELPHSPRPGETFDLRVTGIDGEGWGTAQIEAAVGPGGLPKTYVFKIQRAVPGDFVRFSVRKYRRSIVWGRALVLEPSADRVNQFVLVHCMYAIALLTSSVIMFGPAGIVPGGCMEYWPVFHPQASR